MHVLSPLVVSRLEALHHRVRRNRWTLVARGARGRADSPESPPIAMHPSLLRNNVLGTGRGCDGVGQARATLIRGGSAGRWGSIGRRWSHVELVSA